MTCSLYEKNARCKKTVNKAILADNHTIMNRIASKEMVVPGNPR